MKHATALALAFVCVLSLACNPRAAAVSADVASEALFVSPATPGDAAVVARKGSVEVVAPEATDGGFTLEGRKYVTDWDYAKKRYAETQIEKRVTIEDDAFTFDGKKVELPGGAKARAVWKAALWRGWVIVLGRTSRTDATANQIPPYIANELITFRPDGSGASIRQLSFDASGAEIRILPEAGSAFLKEKAQRSSARPNSVPNPNVEFIVVATGGVTASGTSPERCELVVNLAFSGENDLGFGSEGDYWLVQPALASGAVSAQAVHSGKHWYGAPSTNGAAHAGPVTIHDRALAPRGDLSDKRLGQIVAKLNQDFRGVAHDEAHGPNSCSYVRSLLDALGVSLGKGKDGDRPNGWEWKR